jgi:hypothetical protein
MRDLSDREFMNELFNGMLRPITKKEELDTWLAKIDRGSTWQEVLKEFTNSVEFHLRVQGIIDSVMGSRQEKAI